MILEKLNNKYNIKDINKVKIIIGQQVTCNLKAKTLKIY